MPSQLVGSLTRKPSGAPCSVPGVGPESHWHGFLSVFLCICQSFSGLSLSPVLLVSELRHLTVFTPSRHQPIPSQDDLMHAAWRHSTRSSAKMAVPGPARFCSGTPCAMRASTALEFYTLAAQHRLVALAVPLSSSSACAWTSFRLRPPGVCALSTSSVLRCCIVGRCPITPFSSRFTRHRCAFAPLE